MGASTFQGYLTADSWVSEWSFPLEKKKRKKKAKPPTQHENLHHFCNSRDYNMRLDIRPFPKAPIYKRYQKDKWVFKFMLPFIFTQIYLFWKQSFKGSLRRVGASSFFWPTEKPHLYLYQSIDCSGGELSETETETTLSWIKVHVEALLASLPCASSGYGCRTNYCKINQHVNSCLVSCSALQLCSLLPFSEHKPAIYPSVRDG